MDRYAHLSTGDAAATLDALPDLTRKPEKSDPGRLRATGTFDAIADGAYISPHISFPRTRPHGDARHNNNVKGDNANRGQSEASTKANKDRVFGTVKPGDSSPFSAQREKRATGFEPATFSLEGRCSESVKNDNSKTCETENPRIAADIADFLQNDPDLAAIVRAWPTLPEAVRAAIVGMIRGVSGEGAE